MKLRSVYIFIVGSMALLNTCTAASPTPNPAFDPATPSPTVIAPSKALNTPAPVPTAAEPGATEAPAAYWPISRLFPTQGDPVDETLRGVQYELKAELPTSPESLALYRQEQGKDLLTAQKAGAVAGQLGVRGSTTHYAGEGGGVTFEVQDGKSDILVFSDDPIFFSYNSDSTPVSGNPAKLYPFEQRTKVAVDFLKAHQLLDFKYSVSPLINPNWTDFSVAISQFINGYPLYENYPNNPRIEAALDAEGEVHILIYHELTFKALQSVKIRAAKDVWTDFQAQRLAGRVFARWIDSSGDPNQSVAGISASTQAAIEKVELVYYAVDFSHGSPGSFAADDPINTVMPIWRFGCRLENGRAFEILAEAIQDHP